MKRLWFIIPILFCCVAASFYLPHRRLAFRPSATPGGFTPTDVANMIAWYKADALTGASVGDLVTNWFDSGANGYTLTQDAAARQPYYTNNAGLFNNQPWIQWDGSSDRLLFGGTNIFNQPNTIFAVCRYEGTGSTGVIADGTNATMSHAVRFLSNWRFALYAPTQINGAVNSATNLVGYLAEFTFDHPGNSSTIFTNGVSYVNSTSPGTNHLAGIVIGSAGGVSGASFFKGAIAEVIIYNSDVSAGDRTSLRTYFTTKYGAYSGW